jgi:hypothetical protein
MEGCSAGSFDPLKPAAQRAVRCETLKDVGERAAAVIEQAGPAARHVVSDLVKKVAAAQILLPPSSHLE